MTSPTQRTLEYYKKANAICEIVEYFNYFTKRRKDIFGFGDLLVIENNKVFLVQVTSGSNMSARIKKIKTECKEKAVAWLNSGNKILVISWRKLKNKGRQKWFPRIIEITLEDFE